MGVKLAAASGGSIELVPTNTASNFTVTVPAVTATVLTDSAGILNIGSGQIYKDASGNVGIGTASPVENLDVRGSSTVGTKIFGVGTNANAVTLLVNSAGTQAASYNADTASVQGVLCVGAYTSGGTAYSLVARGGAIIGETTGNLLVGTTTAQGRITTSFSGALVNGFDIKDTADQSGVAFNVFRNGSNGVIGTVTRVNVTNAVTYNTTSDYRLKNVIGAVSGAKERIAAIRPIDYTWKEGGYQARGFLAHEFKEIYPNSVSGEKDAVETVEIKDEQGNVTGTEQRPVMQSMQASSPEVLADMISCIQEQQALIVQLQADVAALKGAQA